MRAALRQACLVAIAFAFAVALVFLFGTVRTYVGIASYAWGWPLSWHWTADMMTGGVSLFGYFLGGVNPARFFDDLLFWMAVSLSAVELVYRFCFLRVIYALRGHDSGRDTMTGTGKKARLTDG